MIMDWIMVPYIPEVDAKSFVAALVEMHLPSHTQTSSLLNLQISLDMK